MFSIYNRSNYGNMMLNNYILKTQKDLFSLIGLVYLKNINDIIYISKWRIDSKIKTEILLKILFNYEV